MARGRTRRWRRLPLGAVLLALLVAPAPRPQDGGFEAARSLDDPRLARLRQASAIWELRSGPRREVIDVVCLVPDAATFLEALGTWDQSHWFPILIEDVEYTSKFLRAFRPARVVRYPGRAEPVEGDRLWAAAVDAVGRSWTAEAPPVPGGDRPPDAVRRPPPGLVISNPSSRSLPGAAALAAGRFQPLVRWEPEKRFGDLISTDEAQALARDLQATVSRIAPHFERLGDDCDFLTMALDYPYRYRGDGVTAEAGPAAFDDLIGRNLDVPRPDIVRDRWAFAGRLLGDEVRSAYAAMCSLFLRPDSATLINAYGEGSTSQFGLYRHAPAADRLGALMPVARRDRARADLAGWHEAFAPVNRAGLVLINSSGGPAGFNLGGSPGGTTWDVPLSEPTVVYKVHSFSAARPNDPSTIAGRWLANGAYIYFGSAHEPYLTSFRTPELVADLLARGLPFGAAVRMLPEEFAPFGNCWRLAYLGDPLFRIDPGPPRRRLDRWAPLDGWPVYEPVAAPATADDPFAVLSWAVREAIDAARRGEPAPDRMINALRSVDRDALDEPFRGYRDLLIADALAQRDRLDELIDVLGGLPIDALGPAARRFLDAARFAALQRALAADDWPAAVGLWGAIAGPKANPTMLRALNDRVRPPRDRPDRLADWRRLLRDARRSLGDQGPIATILDEELARAEEPKAG